MIEVTNKNSNPARRENLQLTRNMKTRFNFLYFLVFIIPTFGLIISCAGENVRKSVEEHRDDNGDTNDESKDESLDIPLENDANNITCTRRQNSEMHEIRTAEDNQFPFMAAIMSQQNNYLCSGVSVSNGMILTTARCTQQPVSYVLMNTTKAVKDDTTVALHVIKTERFPTFTDNDDSKDVGIIYTEKHDNSVASKIKLSSYTNPRSVFDLECLGFGLNADIGQNKELQYIGMENRAPLERAETLRAYFDCVETKVPTCFKDTGGPAIYGNELVGIVTQGQEECSKEMSSAYAVNKRMADILPTYAFKSWLEEKITLNEEKQPAALVAYPLKPQQPKKLTRSRSAATRIQLYHVSYFMISILYYVLAV